VRFQHRGDDLLGGDAREVRQVLLALLESVAGVRGADPLVARGDDVRIEAAMERMLAIHASRAVASVSGQPVHLVDHITGDDGPQRRDVHDRRVLDVALTDVDHAQLVAVEIDRGAVQQFRQHRGLGDLAGNQGSAD
jgi:hypothetical protein